MMKTPNRIMTIRSSSFAEAQSTSTRKTKWAGPDRLEGSQSLRFANAWKSQLRVLQVKGIWNDVANKLKQLYVSLTDDDLRLIQGDEENLMGRLKQRLGMTSHDIRTLIASLWDPVPATPTNRNSRRRMSKRDPGKGETA
jgi:uncharacterized protein YjbJ (UPF0337 family)